MALLLEKMPSISLKVVSLNYVIVILLASSGTSLNFKETILNLEEGSTLNYSTGVEAAESLQLIYVCITKNSSATYEDFDHNTYLSSARDCIVCDNGQNCVHRFNSSTINVTILNQLQNDSTQLYVVTFFKENISLDDNGTKIICAYEAGNTTVPCSWIYLDVHFLPKPEKTINLLVPVAVTLSSVVILFIVLLNVVIFTVMIIRRHKQESQAQALEVANQVVSSQDQPHISNVIHKEELSQEECTEKIRGPGDKDRFPHYNASVHSYSRRIGFRLQSSPSPSLLDHSDELTSIDSDRPVDSYSRRYRYHSRRIEFRIESLLPVLPSLLVNDHSDELISIDIDWPDPQTRADEESSSETEASGVRHKVPDLPDHISSRDGDKK